MIHIDCSREALDFSQYDLAEDEVYVIDNLFPWWFTHHMHELVLGNNAYAWVYGHTSNYATDGRDVGADLDWSEAPAFKQSIYPPKSPNAEDPSFGMVYNAVTGTIPFELELGEVLINGQQWIHDTVIHQDCTCDNGLSWIYYVNRQWDDEWGGPTIIELNGDTVEVLPKPGRVCFFKGNIPHRGSPPNGDKYRGLRATLVYKTMRKVPLPARK
tara:strand:+ start:257 stop:898 length:642 start_codon:yes stop_codon:yes gene_type:complete